MCVIGGRWTRRWRTLPWWESIGGKEEHNTYCSPSVRGVHITEKLYPIKSVMSLASQNNPVSIPMLPCLKYFTQLCCFISQKSFIAGAALFCHNFNFQGLFCYIIILSFTTCHVVKCRIVECVLWYSSLVTLCNNPTIPLWLPINLYHILSYLGHPGRAASPSAHFLATKHSTCHLCVFAHSRNSLSYHLETTEKKKPSIKTTINCFMCILWCITQDYTWT